MLNKSTFSAFNYKLCFQLACWRLLAQPLTLNNQPINLASKFNFNISIICNRNQTKGMKCSVPSKMVKAKEKCICLRFSHSTLSSSERQRLRRVQGRQVVTLRGDWSKPSWACPVLEIRYLWLSGIDFGPTKLQSLITVTFTHYSSGPQLQGNVGLLWAHAVISREAEYPSLVQTRLPMYRPQRQLLAFSGISQSRSHRARRLQGLFNSRRLSCHKKSYVFCIVEGITAKCLRGKNSL